MLKLHVIGIKEYPVPIILTSVYLLLAKKHNLTGMHIESTIIEVLNLNLGTGGKNYLRDARLIKGTEEPECRSLELRHFKNLDGLNNQR
jgi:hypothetical protein